MKNAYKGILLVFAAALSVFSPVHAEEMSFVTVLSSPLGTFANLETANAGRKSTAGTVNFATGGVGRLNFFGGKFPTGDDALKIKLINATLQSDNLTNMKILEGMQLFEGSSIMGKRLIANTVSLEGNTPGRVEVDEGVLYSKTSQVKGAYAGSMNIGGGDSMIGPEFDESWTTPKTEMLVWSNVFQRDSQTGSINQDYTKQYLLTSGKPSGTTGGGDETPTPGNDTPTPTYKCWTGFQWKTYETISYQPYASGKWEGFAGAGAFTKCDKGEMACLPGKECGKCETGKTYVLNGYVYRCSDWLIGANANENGCTGVVPSESNCTSRFAIRYGYYCAKCGEVSSLSECAPAPKNMSYEFCSESGNQGLSEDFVGQH